MGGDTLFSQEGTTQGDPLAMAMPSPHSLDALQMVKQSRSGLLMMPQQVVVSQASRDGGTLLPREDQPMAVTQTRSPNPTKTCLVVKEGNVETAKEVFQGTGISITGDGNRHLGLELSPLLKAL